MQVGARVQVRWLRWRVQVRVRDVALITAASLAVFANSLHGELVYDDVMTIENNADLRPSTSWRKVFLNDSNLENTDGNSLNI